MCLQNEALWRKLARARSKARLPDSLTTMLTFLSSLVGRAARHLRRSPPLSQSLGSQAQWPLARRWPLGLLAMAGALGLGSIQCAYDGSPSIDDSTGGNPGGSPDSSILELGRTRDEGTDGVPLNPLCGKGKCIPDDRKACADDDDEGVGGEGGGQLGGAAGGVSFNPGDLNEVRASCQVGPQTDCKGSSCSIERACTQSGVSPEGSPCVTAADCAPGLACVGEALSGVCRPYCCRGTEDACDENSFCDERRLLETPEVYVPVCLPLDNCQLTEPYPCPDDRQCVCQGTRACMVVRADGATACTVPGAAQAGDSCSDQATADCGYGFVCGPEQRCLQICSTVSAESGCPTGWTCLKQSALGGELGICIASTGQ